MEDNAFISEKARELIEQGIPVVLSTIVNLEGSSPRHIGTKMLVDARGKFYGSIGGGPLEALVIKESRSLLLNGESRFLDFNLSGQNTNATGMICGGDARVFLNYFSSDSATLDFFTSFQDLIREGKSFYFLTHIKESSGRLDILGHYILTPDGQITGTSPSSLQDIQKLEIEVHDMNSTEVLSSGNTKIVVDCIRKLKSLYCFGAGHVALPTAHIASMVGFKVYVLDDRKEFANVDRFPDAYSVRVIDDFNRAFEGLEIDGDSFIIILTRGHQYDREVLEQALKTRAYYIGMISSRKKRDVIYRTLMDTGVKKEELDRVYSPIGLDIKAETPNEIAVSIVSELISIRGKQFKA
ncbi:MAG: XdhC family protein [Dehalococcoidales bacterium]|nr:XdhC family protein [Dehalococcoidales bacterium]